MALADLLDNPEASWVYLLDASPKNASGTTQTVGFSQGEVPDPTFGSTTRQLPPDLATAIDLAINVNPIGVGSAQGTSYGVLEVVLDPDGGEDAIAAYGWAGWPIAVKLGPRGGVLADFEAIYTGKCDGHEILPGPRGYVLRLLLRDGGADLDREIQFENYAGTGSDSGTGACEGGDDLAGVPKPIALGSPRNVTPVLVDATNLIYQVHHRETKSIAVYDGGVAITDAGDTTNLVTASVSGGTFQTDLARGLFRLGTAPTFNVVCDVEGENDGASVTFPQTAADLAEHILLTYTGRTSGDLDATSFSDLNTANSAPLSYYTGTTNPTRRQVLTDLLDSIAAFYWVDRVGDVHVGRLALGTSALTIDESAAEIHSIQRELFIPPWQVRIPYARSWTTGPDHVAGSALQPYYAGSATQAFIRFMSREERLKLSADTAIYNVHLMSRPVRRRAFFDYGTDAEAEALRQRQLLDTAAIWNVAASRIQFKVNIGDTVTIVHSRFGFSGAGKEGIVVGIVENTGTRQTLLRVLVP